MVGYCTAVDMHQWHELGGAMCKLRPLEDSFLCVGWRNECRLYEGVKRNTCNALADAREGKLCVLVVKDYL